MAFVISTDYTSPTFTRSAAALRNEVVDNMINEEGVKIYYFFDFDSPSKYAVEYYRTLSIELAELREARKARRGEI